MWERVDKTKLVQYKMKVELGPDVTQIITDLKTEGVNVEPTPVEAAKEQITQKVKETVTDSMIKDSRDVRGGMTSISGVKPIIEDNKEQESEASANYNRKSTVS